MDRRQFLRVTGASALAIVAASAAQAEWKPRRPINAIVPYDAGGVTDVTARAITTAMGESIPVPLVIVNKPGASGIVGATAAANAKANGSTILITSAGSFVLNSIMKDLEIDPFEDFIPVGQVGDRAASIMVPMDSPFQSAADLVAAAKANPGSLRWAHTGRGSFSHVAGQGFLNSKGITAVDVAFKGGNSARTAVIGGQVDFGIIGIQQAAGFANELRALALFATERDSFATDVPTTVELGIEAPMISSPTVVFVPAGTPDDVVKTMSAAVEKAAGSAQFKELMANGNNTPKYLPGPELREKLLRMREEARATVASLSR